MSKILVFGDSVAYGKWDIEGGWVSRLRKYIDEEHNIERGGNFQVYNLGIPGEVAIRTQDRVEKELLMRINSSQKNLVILAIGINDSNPSNAMVGKETSEHDFKNAISNIIDVVRKYKCEIVVVGLLPVKEELYGSGSKNAREYDGYLTDVCQEKNVSKIELFDDLKNSGFQQTLVDWVHPNNDGHNILYEKILDFLKKKGLL